MTTASTHQYNLRSSVKTTVVVKLAPDKECADDVDQIEEDDLFFTGRRPLTSPVIVKARNAIRRLKKFRDQARRLPMCSVNNVSKYNQSH